MGKYIKEGNGGFIRDDGVKFKVDNFIRINGIDILCKFVGVLEIDGGTYTAYVQPYLKQKCINGIDYLKETYCLEISFDRIRNVPTPIWVQCDCDDWNEGHYLFRPLIKGFTPDIDASLPYDMQITHNDLESCCNLA